MSNRRPLTDTDFSALIIETEIVWRSVACSTRESCEGVVIKKQRTKAMQISHCVFHKTSHFLWATLPLNRVAWLVSLYFRSHGIIKNDNHVTYVNRLAFEPKYSLQIEFLIDFHACVKDFLASEGYFLCVVSCDNLQTPWISCFARGGTLFNSCVSGFGFVLSR